MAKVEQENTKTVISSNKKDSLSKKSNDAKNMADDKKSNEHKKDSERYTQNASKNSVVSSKIGDNKSLTASKADFHTKTFKSLKPIVGTELVEIEIDDVKFYMEHSDEYRIQKGERLIPYIIRMNERYKSKVESRIKHRKIKRGMLIFFVVFGAIIAIILVIYVISKVKGKGSE